MLDAETLIDKTWPLITIYMHIAQGTHLNNVM